MDAKLPEISLALPAACLIAVSAFAVSIIVGVISENPASAILARSLVVMIISWPAGLALGAILERLFREQTASEAARTIESDALPEESDDDVEIVDEVDVESDASSDASLAA